MYSNGTVHVYGYSFFFILLLALLNDKYEAAHRSVDGVGIKALDYFVKKKTDHFNNLINAYV